MSEIDTTETTTATTTAPAPKPAPKAKAKPVKATKATRRPTKAKATKPSANGVTSVQYRVLKALAKVNGSLTRVDIKNRAFNGNSVNLKPILDPLVSAKLVTCKELDIDGKAEVNFTATAAGRKAATKPAPAARSSNAEHQALPRVGGTFTKTYLGKEVTVKVVADGFQVNGKTYPSLTAAAKAVRGSEMEVNGWAFFGLTK